MSVFLRSGTLRTGLYAKKSSRTVRIWLASSPCCSSLGRHEGDEPYAWQVQRSGADAEREEWAEQCSNWSLEKINHLFVYPWAFSHLCTRRCGIYLLLLGHRWIGLFSFWWRGVGVFAWQGREPLRKLERKFVDNSERNRWAQQEIKKVEPDGGKKVEKKSVKKEDECHNSYWKMWGPRAR